VLAGDSEAVAEAAVAAGAVELLQAALAGPGAAARAEAAHSLANIASWSLACSAAAVVAAPLLVELLADAPPRVQESSLLALGNLAGDGVFDTTLRDRVRAAGALPPVVRAAGSDAPAVARTALWALANLLRGPAPRLEEALDAGAGDAVVRVLLRPGTPDGLTEEALWAASLLSHACPPMHARLLESGAAARALAILAAPPATGDSLRMPALRVVGNLAAGADACTDALLHACSAADSGQEGAALLPALRALLADERRALRKEAAWVVGNVCAGTPAHRAAAVAAELPAELVRLLQTADFDVRREERLQLFSPRANGSNSSRPEPRTPPPAGRAGGLTAARTGAKQAAYAVLHLAHDAEAGRTVLSRALAAEMVGLLRAPDAQLAGAALQVVARLLEQPALPDLPGGAAGGAVGARIVEEEGGIDGLEHLVHPRPRPRPRRAASHLLPVAPTAGAGAGVRRAWRRGCRRRPRR
jgi:hypothetical protein